MMSLKIDERRIGDVTILDMEGKVTIGESSVVLRDAVHNLLKQGRKKVLLNLAGVPFIDLSGLGELISSYVALNKNGGQVKFLHLTQRVHEMMTITKLLTVFDVYDSKAAALGSFKSPLLELEERRPAVLVGNSP
jgi:anti-sigma B factor antagonist